MKADLDGCLLCVSALAGLDMNDAEKIRVLKKLFGQHKIFFSEDQWFAVKAARAVVSTREILDYLDCFRDPKLVAGIVAIAARNRPAAGRAKATAGC